VSAEARRLGVLGWPVAHSLSPRMQNAALQARGMSDWSYQALPVPPELFAETVRALPGAGFRGANVTIPHKAAALALADRPSPVASAIGAANTLLFEPGGEIMAENTDAPGLIAALGFEPRGLSALVLGAGGSARAAVWALLDAGASPVSIFNRTPERAGALAGELGGNAVPEPVEADLLVNCTSVGLDASDEESAVLAQLGLSRERLASYPHVVDLVYAERATALIALARAGGATAVDGREVLLAQGALSFELWTGLAAPLEAMRTALTASAAR
jgi:shikimate dehydrogenase